MRFAAYSVLFCPYSAVPDPVHLQMTCAYRGASETVITNRWWGDDLMVQMRKLKMKLKMANEYRRVFCENMSTSN